MKNRRYERSNPGTLCLPKVMIGIIGGHTANTSPHALQLAENFGELLGIRGIPLVCGGEDGIMEACCRGSKRTGGTTIGVLMGNDYRAANKYIDYPIVTAMSVASNNIIVRTAAGIVAFDGMYGTLNEVALAFDIGKPLITIGTHRLLNVANITHRLFAHYEGYNVEMLPSILEHLLEMIGQHQREFESDLDL